MMSVPAVMEACRLLTYYYCYDYYYYYYYYPPPPKQCEGVWHRHATVDRMGRLHEHARYLDVKNTPLHGIAENPLISAEPLNHIYYLISGLAARAIYSLDTYINELFM